MKKIYGIFGLVALLVLVAISYYRASDGFSSVSTGLSSVDLERVTATSLFEVVENSEAKVTLVNLWATWCAPCIEEFPYLMRLHRTYEDQGFRVVFVSMDSLNEIDRAKIFLAEQGVDFTTYIKDQSDNDFIRELNPNWSGALPASFVYNDRMELLNFWTGDLTYEEFENRIVPLLETKKGGS